MLGGDEDSTDLHLADTLAAGAGLCDEEAVRILVDEGPGRVHELITLGVEFDREATGLLALAREGGHSRPRVVHAGGAATGAEVERALVDATYRTASAVLEGWFALDLLIEGGRCVRRDRRCRRTVPRSRSGPTMSCWPPAGRASSSRSRPTRPSRPATASPWRCGPGCPTADVEFVQFHPTALHHPAMPRPLLSEALRGHGALLRDAGGERFVDELAPRDVVSRAMAARMAEQGTDHLWLDATGLERVPAALSHHCGVADLHRPGSRDRLAARSPRRPITSRAVWSPICGARRRCPGLWAVGEVACTGVHGANRLASNSLLEGMVFGARLAERIASDHSGPEPSGALRAVLGARAARRHRRAWSCRTAAAGRGRTRPSAERSARRGQAPRLVAADHDRRGRRGAERAVPGAGGRRRGRRGRRPGRPHGFGGGRRAGQPRATGRRPPASAGTRTESRGAHSRSDYPDTEPRLAPAPGARCAVRRAPVPACTVTQHRERRDVCAGQPGPRSGRRRRGGAGPWPKTSWLTATSPRRWSPTAPRRMFALRARQAGVLAGRACATETFRQLDPQLALIWYLGDGSVLVAGQTIMEVTGRCGRSSRQSAPPSTSSGVSRASPP